MAKPKYSRIAGDHHVVRHCNSQRIERDPQTGAVVGLFPKAMELRADKGETYLSTSWLEHCAGSKMVRLKAVVAILRTKREVKPSSGVATLKAGNILEIGRNCGHRLAVRSTPQKTDPSYSRISGLPLDNSDTELIGLLAEEAYKDLKLISQVDTLK